MKPDVLVVDMAKQQPTSYWH